MRLIKSPLIPLLQRGKIGGLEKEFVSYKSRPSPCKAFAEGRFSLTLCIYIISYFLYE